MEWIVGIILIVLVLSTTPVAAALLISAATAFYFFTDISLDILSIKTFNNIRSSPLLAVLFFILAGRIMTTGDIAKHIIEFTRKVIGFVPGGLAIAGVFACAIFAAISGSSPATVIAIGSIMIPALVEEGYSSRFATGLMATSGSMGILIPPSIPMIIYALIVNVSVGELFLAGVVPGLMMAIVLSLYSFFSAKKNNVVFTHRAGSKQLIKTFTKGGPALGLPLVILGGIYSGAFTPTEAAAIAVAYALLIELFIYRSIEIKRLYEIFVDSGVMTAVLLIIVTCASAFGEYLTIEQIPGKIADIVISNINSPILFLITVNLLLLFVGTFMDIISTMLIIMPIFAPLLSKYGLDPIHFAIIFIFNMEIGYLTPPLGVNLYVAAGISGMNFLK